MTYSFPNASVLWRASSQKTLRPWSGKVFSLKRFSIRDRFVRRYSGRLDLLVSHWWAPVSNVLYSRHEEARRWRGGRTTSEEPGGKPPKRGPDDGRNGTRGCVGVCKQQESVSKSSNSDGLLSQHSHICPPPRCVRPRTHKKRMYEKELSEKKRN